MTALRGAYHVSLADFLERVRRRSFLFVLIVTVGAGYLFVPPVGAAYRVLEVGAYRGVYNSSWIGLMFGLIAAMHLPLIGFYLVKNTIGHDRATGVGEIIAATPTAKLEYVFGKWLSNLAVLSLILAVLTATAAVMQLVRAEEKVVDLAALIVPIWLMGFPVLAAAAAMAVLFESVSFLRGGLGNVVYFVVWLATLIGVLTGAIDEATGMLEPVDDIMGFTRQMSSIQHDLLAIEPDADVVSGLIIMGENTVDSTFVWEGIEWSPGIVLARAGWLTLGLTIALASALPFDRFDPARSRRARERGTHPERP